MDDLTFHDLRRVNATTMMAEGVDLRTAMGRLGHTSPRMTLQVYAQVSEEANRRAADALGEALGPADSSALFLLNGGERSDAAANAHPS